MTGATRPGYTEPPESRPAEAALGACSRHHPEILAPHHPAGRRPLTRSLLVSYHSGMTATLTIRLPRDLAQKFRAKTRAAKTNPSAVLREAAATYVRADPTASNGVLEHLRARAGTWDGTLSGQELLRRTRR